MHRVSHLGENNGADSKLHGKTSKGGLYSVLFSELVQLSPPDRLVDCYAIQCSIVNESIVYKDQFMRWDSTPFKNSMNMKTLGGLFNNHGNMPIPLRLSCITKPRTL